MQYLKTGEGCRFQIVRFTCHATLRHGRVRIDVTQGDNYHARYFCSPTLPIKEIQKYTANRLLRWLKDCGAQVEVYLSRERK
jgi:hypothetical protein